MPFVRRHDAWITMFFGVLAVGTWAFHGLQAAFAEDPVSTKALFVWLAAAMVGWALAMIFVLFTAPLRAKQLQSYPAMTKWGVNNSSLTAGIFLLGVGTSPVYSPSAGTWDWSLLLMSAFVGAFVLSVALCCCGANRASGRVPPSRTKFWVANAGNRTGQLRRRTTIRTSADRAHGGEG